MEGNDAAETERQDAAIRSTMLVEIALLKAAAEKGPNDLLEHVYGAHPPKKASDRRKTTRERGGVTVPIPMKDQLKQALVHYHPDKAARENDPKWRVLVAEISKYISNAYNEFKGN